MSSRKTLQIIKLILTLKEAPQMVNMLNYIASPLAFFYFSVVITVVFLIILFIKNKKAFIAYCIGTIILSVFFAFMFHNPPFHMFTLNHFITMFLCVLISSGVGFGLIGIATIEEWM